MCYLYSRIDNERQTDATAATEPGKSESVSVTSTEGNKTFNVILGNNAGLGEKARIYSLGSVLVRKNALTTDGLPAGVYIINGKKFIVK